MMNEKTSNSNMFRAPPAETRPEALAETPPTQPQFDPIATCHTLLRSASFATLATLEPATPAMASSAEIRFPFASLTNYALDVDGTPLILISRLAAHTKNLLADPHCSLLLAAQGKGDPLSHARLTILCIAEKIATGHEKAEHPSDQYSQARARFLARHPKAKLYIDFPDFLLMRLVPQRIHLNGGFGKAFESIAAPVFMHFQA